jgi:hypothetical protein
VKIDRTKPILDSYASGLRQANAHSVATGLEALSSLLGEFGDVPMATFVARGTASITAIAIPNAGNRAELSQLAEQVELLGELLGSAGAKLDHMKDLRDLAVLLRRHGESENLTSVLEKLRLAMQPEPIELKISSYIERLRRETGTSAFERTLAELTKSPLKREHVLAIAKSVYGGIKSNTSRIKALAYIRKPHDAYLSTKRGIDANGGRSAA